MPGGAEAFNRTWHSPSQTRSILLNLKLLHSIRGWIDKTHPAQQEVGGLLLGRLDRGRKRASISVESCEPMHISHHLGPEFALTDGERDLLLKRFSAPREGGLQPVGFVRSDLRNCLDLDAADQQLLQSAPGEAIYLVVRPGPDYTAACFSARGEKFEQRLNAIPAPAFERWPLSRWLAAVAACLFIAFAGAGYYWQQSQPVAGPRGLGLNVHQTGKELRLTWNPRALHGPTVLLVNDGASQRRIRLNPEEIEHGAALYIPASSQVSFRLETSGVADSIWLVPSAAPPLPAKSTQEMATRREVEPQKTAAVRPSKPDHEGHDRVAPKLIPVSLTAKKKAARPEQPLVAEPVRLLPAVAKQEASKLLPPKLPAIAPAPPPASPIAVPEPLVTVNYTASADESARHGIEKVPVLRMFKHSHNIQPARPVGDLKPHVPHALARQISGEGVVRVEATVDKHGHVSSVEPLTSQADQRLVRLVTDSVNRASFYPAQANGRDVNSKLVLTFRFSNSNATTASRATVR